MARRKDEDTVVIVTHGRRDYARRAALASYRQGDVLLVACSGARPEGARAVLPVDGRVVLARGEETGHAHSVLASDATLWLDEDADATYWRDLEADASRVREDALTGLDLEDTQLYLEVARPTELRHEEHAPIALAPGHYLVIRQRQYATEFLGD